MARNRSFCAAIFLIKREIGRIAVEINSLSMKKICQVAVDVILSNATCQFGLAVIL